MSYQRQWYAPMGAATAPATVDETAKLTAAVTAAAKPGGLAAAYASSGEDHGDILGELILASVRIGAPNAGAAIAQQATSDERGAIMAAPGMVAAAKKYGIPWQDVADVIVAGGVTGAVVTPNKRRVLGLTGTQWAVGIGVGFVVGVASGFFSRRGAR